MDTPRTRFDPYARLSFTYIFKLTLSRARGCFETIEINNPSLHYNLHPYHYLSAGSSHPVPFPSKKKHYIRNPKESISNTLNTIPTACDRFSTVPRYTMSSLTEMHYPPTGAIASTASSCSPPASTPSPSTSSATTAQSSATRRPPRKSTLTQQQKNNKRQRATQDQLVLLEIEFNKNPTPTAATRERIASDINMTERSVQIWFQNR